MEKSDDEILTELENSKLFSGWSLGLETQKLIHLVQHSMTASLEPLLRQMSMSPDQDVIAMSLLNGVEGEKKGIELARKALDTPSDWKKQVISVKLLHLFASVLSIREEEVIQLARNALSTLDKRYQELPDAARPAIAKFIHTAHQYAVDGGPKEKPWISIYNKGGPEPPIGKGPGLPDLPPGFIARGGKRRYRF